MTRTKTVNARGWKNTAACFGGCERRLLSGGSVSPAPRTGGMSAAEQPWCKLRSCWWDGLGAGIARELLWLTRAGGLLVLLTALPPHQRPTPLFRRLRATDWGSVPTRWACLDSDGILSRKHTAGGWGRGGEETSSAPRFSLRAHEAVNGREVGELSSSQDWGQRNSHRSSLPKL